MRLPGKAWWGAVQPGVAPRVARRTRVAADWAIVEGTQLRRMESGLRMTARMAAPLALGGAGLALLSAAVVADGRWVDRHLLLPFYFNPVPTVWVTGFVRGALILVAMLLLFVARRRLAAAPVSGAAAARALAAVVASVLATEAILRLSAPHPASGSPRYELKVGQRHPRFGWISRASQTTAMSVRGRGYQYAVNAQGLRARTDITPTDVSLPALVVTGESIANGFGLPYDETFAARCGQNLGLEVVNVAEGGYGLDQAYLRLLDVLPRLQRPSVVVTIFVGPELGRMTRDDRPRLAMGAGGAVELLPPATGLLAGTRLHDLFHNRLPYLSEGSLERSLRLASVLLPSIAEAARARGARPLFVLPSVGPPRPFEQHRERDLWQRLFVEPGLPHLVVDLPPGELIPVDGHPDAAAARRIAAAIESALRAGLAADRLP